MSNYHRCRRSCEALVPRSKAFCPPCWRRVPKRVQVAIYRSWSAVLGGGDYGAHAELLLDAEAALEDERPWESVACA